MTKKRWRLVVVMPDNSIHTLTAPNFDHEYVLQLAVTSSADGNNPSVISVCDDENDVAAVAVKGELAWHETAKVVVKYLVTHYPHPPSERETTATAPSLEAAVDYAKWEHALEFGDDAEIFVFEAIDAYWSY